MKHEVGTMSINSILFKSPNEMIRIMDCAGQSRVMSLKCIPEGS